MDPEDDENGGGVPLGSLHISDSIDGLKSNIARNQEQPVEATSLNKERGHKGSRAERPRNEYRRRKAVRAELYNHSLITLGDSTRSSISSDTMSQILNIRREKIVQDLITSISTREEDRMLESLKPSTLTLPDSASMFSTWVILELLICRNMALSVYANCKTLQASNLAGEFISILVLCEPFASGRQNVVSLKRVSIHSVKGLAESLVRATRVLPSLNFAEMSFRGTDDMPTFLSVEFLLLMHTFGTVHTHCTQILDQLGLVSLATELELDTLRKRLACGKTEPTPKEIDYFSALFTRWRCVLEILDFGILAYEGAHFFPFEQHIFGSKIDHFSFPEHSLSLLPIAHSRAQEGASVYFYRLQLSCLAGLLDNSDVWVLGLIKDAPTQALYLVSDIETFADVWGPVWKVVDRSRPVLFSRYNVGNGSIIPWLWDSKIHPILQSGERLCHWKAIDEHIKIKAVDSSESSSPSMGSDLEESFDFGLEIESFTGSISELLVIGADSHSSDSYTTSTIGQRLRWKICHCSINSIKQHLKEAGRLDHMIASKSYQYTDSQQASLVIGSHGLQAGSARTIKNKREETLKASLLHRWENESASRDPREFENYWGVAVSLCTMNARRVRLVQLLGEESVISLLSQFPWSEAQGPHQDSDGTLEKQYLKAVRSADPLSLGNLWERRPSWREELGNALLLCLRMLAKTGYDENRDEFHILWTPPGCRSARRITLKPKEQTWIKFVKDTTSSMTIAVAVEDSLRGKTSCNGIQSQRGSTPSILETAISINRSLDPASTLIKVKGCHDDDRWLQRIDGRKWRYSWDVSGFDGRREPFWMDSQCRLQSVRPLSQWCLLLEMDTVKRLLLRELMGMRPSEQLGHWEYTDEEAESVKYRPVPVHIIS